MRFDPGTLAKTESWNGSNWTEVNDLNTARTNLGAAGTYTSALVLEDMTDQIAEQTEDWNGASWVETSDLNAQLEMN